MFRKLVDESLYTCISQDSVLEGFIYDKPVERIGTAIANNNSTTKTKTHS